MFKRIDKLVISAFMGPFVLTFAVTTFILLTQYMLKYFEDFVGKDLGLPVFAELLFYFSINMMPVAMPLAVLLSCLITFGNLGEHNELTALKTSGVTVLRVIRPVFIFVCFITVGIFWFNDQIVPRANLRAYSLLYDIRQKKPALDVRPGIFYYGLPGYAVKVNKKGADGRTIGDIIIYDHTAARGNVSVIMADSGKMYTINGDRYLVLELFRGRSYTEVVESDPRGTEYVQNAFAKSKLIFSLASFDMNRTQVELFSQNRMMRNISELKTDVDSIRRETGNLQASLPQSLAGYYYYHTKPATNKKAAAPGPSALPALPLSDSLKREIPTLALSQARNIKSYTVGYADRLREMSREERLYQIEFTKKFTQSFACLVLFMIGAPLGAIIRKGGLGVPVLISIMFFVVYYITSELGIKWAKDGGSTITFGLWYGNVILFVIGLFFLNQARHDAALFEVDYYKRWFRRKG